MNQAITHLSLAIAPAKVMRGEQALPQAGEAIAHWVVAPRGRL
jgi:hypothetical protein